MILMNLLMTVLAFFLRPPTHHVTLEYEPNSVDTKYGSEKRLAPRTRQGIKWNSRYCNNKKWQLPKVASTNFFYRATDTGQSFQRVTFQDAAKWVGGLTIKQKYFRERKVVKAERRNTQERVYTTYAKQCQKVDRTTIAKRSSQEVLIWKSSDFNTGGVSWLRSNYQVCSCWSSLLCRLWSVNLDQQVDPRAHNLRIFQKFQYTHFIYYTQVSYSQRIVPSIALTLIDIIPWRIFQNFQYTHFIYYTQVSYSQRIVPSIALTLIDIIPWGYPMLPSPAPTGTFSCIRVQPFDPKPHHRDNQKVAYGLFGFTLFMRLRACKNLESLKSSILTVWFVKLISNIVKWVSVKCIGMRFFNGYHNGSHRKAFEVSCCLLDDNRCTEKVPTSILGMLLANLYYESKKILIALGMGDPTAFSCFTTTNVAENPVVDVLSSQKFNGYSPTVILNICGCVCLGRIYRKLKGLWNGLIGVLVKSWQMGQNDQRKAVSLAKMGLPLALISLLIFWNEPLSDISEHYVWDILIGFFKEWFDTLIGEGLGVFANVVKMVHGLVVLHGYEGETTVVNALITAYFGSGSFGEG
ncbi:Aminotransferase, class I/classII [Artemisia annua]|uniref:Aminotransferase, class I/classII n=1 Tax=Artemisia annua TaxID=35608 RepID=A0A2U1P0Q1_ARTAN|nr:Aminotransferase, class I/classII [Artemisia annua]